MSPLNDAQWDTAFVKAFSTFNVRTHARLQAGEVLFRGDWTRVCASLDKRRVVKLKPWVDAATARAFETGKRVSQGFRHPHLARTLDVIRMLQVEGMAALLNYGGQVRQACRSQPR